MKRSVILNAGTFSALLIGLVCPTHANDVNHPASAPLTHIPANLPAVPPGAESIRAPSVHRLFENAQRAHPGEFTEADIRDSVYTLDRSSGDTGLLGDGDSGSRIPGEMPNSRQGYRFGERGYAPPEGMPESPVPDHSGQGPTRSVGSPSASLRDAGADARSSMTLGPVESRSGSRIDIGPIQAEVAPAAEKDIPKEDLIKLQDGNAPLPAGVRLRPGDLDVNPDPERFHRVQNPAETLHRVESPDQVNPPSPSP